MLYYINYNNNHLKHEAMAKKVIEMGFYWAGYTDTIYDIIKECSNVVCHCVNKTKKLNYYYQYNLKNKFHLYLLKDILFD